MAIGEQHAAWPGAATSFNSDLAHCLVKVKSHQKLAPGGKVNPGFLPFTINKQADLLAAEASQIHLDDIKYTPGSGPFFASYGGMEITDGKPAGLVKKVILQASVDHWGDLDNRRVQGRVVALAAHTHSVASYVADLERKSRKLGGEQPKFFRQVLALDASWTYMVHRNQVLVGQVATYYRRRYSTLLGLEAAQDRGDVEETADEEQKRKEINNEIAEYCPLCLMRGHVHRGDAFHYRSLECRDMYVRLELGKVYRTVERRLGECSDGSLRGASVEARNVCWYHT